MMEIEDNSNCEEAHATLRVIGDALDPDELTALLRVQPSFARRKGDEYGGPTRTVRSRTGVWALESSGVVESTRLEHHLAYLLDTVGERQELLRQYVSQRGLELDVSCFWMSATGHGGPVLSADLLSRLGTLGAMLSFDFYSAV